MQPGRKGAWYLSCTRVLLDGQAACRAAWMLRRYLLLRFRVDANTNAAVVLTQPSLALWHSLLLVALGGAVGAVLRALLTLAATGMGWKGLWGTLAANVIGCCVAGALLGATRWASDPQHALKFLVMVGVLGGLTTFSALSVETVQLFQQGKHAAALANLGLNLALGLGGVWLGMKAGQLLR